MNKIGYTMGRTAFMFGKREVRERKAYRVRASTKPVFTSEGWSRVALGEMAMIRPEYFAQHEHQ